MQSFAHDAFNRKHMRRFLLALLCLSLAACSARSWTAVAERSGDTAFGGPGRFEFDLEIPFFAMLPTLDFQGVVVVVTT